MAPKKSRKKSAPASQHNPSTSALTREAPLVFISHDTRDADLAEAFGNLLTDASGGFLQSFRSSDRKGTSGIEFGAEWYTTIMSKLDQATDVVALLTPHSLDRPWILYETGVAKGKLDATVLGLTLGIQLEQANSGPFAQFQNCAEDEDSITKLVLQLIRRNPNAQPREQAVKLQVQAFQASIKGTVEKRAKTPAHPAKVDDNAIAKMFEEVKVLVRDLPDRVGSQVQESSPMRRRMSKRFHPMMLEEMLSYGHRAGDANEQAIALTIVLSMFREDVPWFYELGMPLVSAMKSGKMARIHAAHRALMIGCEIAFHGPIGHALGLERGDGGLEFPIRHLTKFVERLALEPRRRGRKISDDASSSEG
ncbi:MAG: toll/interleukin-1 receptor domain-containing protein [Opitutaceae bacterium]|jgi:hypothetical protein